MIRRGPRLVALVALTVAALLVVLGAVLGQVGHPYPGFFFSADYRVFPVSPSARAAGLVDGDRILAVDGRSPDSLMTRIAAAPGATLYYEMERGSRRFAVDLASEPFTRADLVNHFAGYFIVSALMLAVGLLVFAQANQPLPSARLRDVSQGEAEAAYNAKVAASLAPVLIRQRH